MSITHGWTSAATPDGSDVTPTNMNNHTITGQIPAANLDLPWFDLTTYGAACDNATDDTAAWQDAIDAMAAAGGGYCTVPGLSLVTSQLTLPSIDYADTEAMTIGFIGSTAPPGVPSVVGTTPLYVGPGIRTTATSGTIFSGSSSGGLDNFTNVRFALYNMLVRAPVNPAISALDVLKVANIDFEHVQVDAGSMSVPSISLQSTATSYGIKLPRVNNGATVILRDVNVIGFYNGIQFSEHVNAEDVFAWGCRRPWRGEGAWHANWLAQCGWYHCSQGVEFVAGPYTNENYVTWSECNIERADSGTWVQTGADIVDSSNYGYGDVKWHAVEANTGVVHTFTKTGGANIYDLELGGNPFPASFATPAIVLGSAAAAGVASTVIRSDATVVAFDATAPASLSFGDTSATGAAAYAARRDHVHGMPAASGSHILLADGRSTPFAFTDLLQADDGSDFLWSD